MMMSVAAKLHCVVRHCLHSPDRATKDNTINSPIHVKLPPLRTPNPHHMQTTKPPFPCHQHTKPAKHLTPKKSCSSSDIVRLMGSLRHPIPPDIYTSLIKECTLSSDPTEALYLHSYLVNNTNLKLTPPLVHRLLLMLVSCGQLDIARDLFDKIPWKKDFISWVIIIVGCFINSKYEMGIHFFIDMVLQHNVYDFMFDSPMWVIVILCIIEACVTSMNMSLGKQVHGLLLKLGATNEDCVYISLMEFYGKFGCLEDANSVFNKLDHLNAATWNAKIVNSCRNGCFYEAIEDFKEMGKTGIRRSSFTLSSVLRACARMDDDGKCGKQVHAIAFKLGLETDAYMQCGLIDMYGKCGMVKDAKQVFEMIANKISTACWNALVMAYVRNGLFIDAIKVLYQMDKAKIQVDESLVNRVRISCGTNVWEQN